MATPNMSLILPAIGTAGWAAKLLTALTAIDAHNHTTVGAQLAVGSIDFDAEVGISSNNLTNVASIRASDITCSSDGTFSDTATTGVSGAEKLSNCIIAMGAASDINLSSPTLSTTKLHNCSAVIRSATGTYDFTLTVEVDNPVVLTQFTGLSGGPYYAGAEMTSSTNLRILFYNSGGNLANGPTGLTISFMVVG